MLQVTIQLQLIGPTGFKEATVLGMFYCWNPQSLLIVLNIRFTDMFRQSPRPVGHDPL